MKLKDHTPDLNHDALRPTAADREQAAALLDSFAQQIESELAGQFFAKIRPQDYESGRAILEASPSRQVAVVTTAISRIAKGPSEDHGQVWAMRALLTVLCRRNLPYDEQSLIHMLAASQCANSELPVGSVVGAVARYGKKNSISDPMREKLEALQAKFNSSADDSESRKIGERIESLLGNGNGNGNGESVELDLNTGEAWTNALLVELGQLSEVARTTWYRFLQHCATARSAKPAKTWLKTAAELLDSIAEQQFVDVVCPVLAAIGQPGTSLRRNVGGFTHFTEPTEIHATHADLLRGLVWSTQLFDNEFLISAVGDAAVNSFKKVPNVGPRSPKTGNACLVALSSMSSQLAIAQLGRIKSRAKHASTRKQLARALERAASDSGMTETDLEELAVPAFGMTEIGRDTQTLGEVTAEIIVQSYGKPVLAWVKEDGTRQKTVPAAVKSEFADQLKALKKKFKDIATLLPSLRYRVEQLCLHERRWPLADFRKRYLDHPLMGVIARELIWIFDSSAGSTAAIWRDNAFVDVDGQPVAWLDDNTTVSLWHPIHFEAEQVLRWREWLEQHEIVQPFKQAHREIYLLTDAERETQHYSNRFAAHIVRQHQLSALCEQRGWRYQLQGQWDSFNVPTLELPQHDLRAEFWVEPVVDRESSQALIYVYLSTDQVRFSRLNNRLPISLEEIPPRVFSEVMREVDLFVGVASVGNDPNWADGGAIPFDGEWKDLAFGDLSQTAQTRRDVLQRTIPRLKIGSQCSFDNKFLIVKGKLRTYKIHLGSGNVLMLPNDQYLCIVQKRGGHAGTGNIYLPFEGDSMLSVILSKALLLAADDKIKDPSIVHQIGSLGVD